jgi:putative CRISPR-associated protein (TIGR02620 family)
MNNNIYIITRHQGSVKWLNSKGIYGKVLSHLEDDQIMPNSVYIGILPVTFIKQILDEKSRFFLLTLPDINISQRSLDLSAEEVDKAGAGLVEIKNLDMVTVDISEFRTTIGL